MGWNYYCMQNQVAHGNAFLIYNVAAHRLVGILVG